LLSEYSASALDKSVWFLCTGWGWLVQHIQLFCDIDEILTKSFLVVALDSDYVSVVHTLDFANQGYKLAGEGWLVFTLKFSDLVLF
jgi:hypothetical protein